MRCKSIKGILIVFGSEHLPPVYLSSGPARPMNEKKP